MIKAIAHVCIETTDLEKTERFYCGVLGLRRQFKFIRQGKLYGFYLRINEHNFIEFFERGARVPAEVPQRIRHLCLEVEDINKVEEALKSAGVETRGKITGADHSWQMWCTDPNGLDIEFHQYTDQSCQRTGADCVLG